MSVSRVLAVDTAQPIDSYQARNLAALGVNTVFRYLSTPGDPKNITAAEAQTLQAAGLNVGLIFQTTADRALAGAAAGTADALSAAQQAANVGLGGALIFFAVDQQVTLDSDFLLVQQYLAAANAAIVNQIGVYGEYAVCAMMLDRAVITHAWQTYAWSSGLWEGRAEAWQVQNDQKFGQLTVDVDLVKVPT